MGEKMRISDFKCMVSPLWDGQEIQDGVYRTLQPVSSVKPEPLPCSSSRKMEFMCLKHVRQKRDGDKQRQTHDLAFGLGAVYSSGGCTFLKVDHMTGEMREAYESGSSHRRAELSR